MAVFDTAFHLDNPAFANTYAVPARWRDAGLRRYGFHGTSHKYVAERAAQEIGRPFSDLQLVSIHLGNGASICAVNRGHSMDSSMGMTPLEGLVMGTRSGDVDPGAFGFLSRELQLSVQEIEDALYYESGLKGLAGSSDMRDIEDRAAKGDPEAQLAIEIYAYRAKKYVGAYAAAMGGLSIASIRSSSASESPSFRRSWTAGSASHANGTNPFLIPVCRGSFHRTQRIDELQPGKVLLVVRNHNAVVRTCDRSDDHVESAARAASGLAVRH